MRTIINLIPIWAIVMSMLFAMPVRAQEIQPPLPIENDSALMPYLPDVHGKPLLQPLTSDDLQKWYVPGRNYVVLKPVTAIEVIRADNSLSENPGPKLPRMGLVRRVEDKPFSIGDVTAMKLSETSTQSVRALAIQSSGALGLRLHFSKFDVSKGEVLVFSRNETGLVVRGPYQRLGPNESGEFWTESLPGDTAYVELRNDGGTGHVEIDSVVHIDNLPSQSQPNALSDSQKNIQISSFFPSPNLFGNSFQASSSLNVFAPSINAPEVLTCHLDLGCYANQVNADAVAATVLLAFVTPDGGSSPWCSATLINDLDGETYVPYLLTAYHCISTQAQASAIEAIFFYQTSTCGGAVPNYFSAPRLIGGSGGTLVSTNPTDTGNDMALIRMNGVLPAGAALVGWNTGDLPTNLVGIHHPAGASKKVTLLTNDKTVGTCNNTPTNQYHYLKINNGTSEGGSSGSGLFDADGRIRGQLLGSCPDMDDGKELACDNQSKFNLVYGRFNITDLHAHRWFEIGGTISVNHNFNGFQMGTPSQPFRTVSAANNFGWDGVRIKIKAGSYPEGITLSRPGTILADGGAVLIGQ